MFLCGRLQGRRELVVLAVVLVFLARERLSAQAAGKANPAATQTIPAVSDEITVLGQPEPVKLSESSRSGAVLEVPPVQLDISGVADLLRTDSSVDIEQRGGGGTQADIGIRGASFEQTLVLLDGMRINDVETSHFNLDVPVPLEGIAALDVLHGAGSTLYGSDALGGVVNLRTAAPSADSVRVQTGFGSYGINTQTALLSGLGRRWSEELAGGRDFSTGFIPDRDYRSEEASTESRVETAAGVSDVFLAGSDRAFGAADFYGEYPSFEHTKGWYAMLHQDLGARTQAAVAYRRHTDIFVLLRTDPAFYTNQHIDESWEALLRRNDSLSRHLQLATGLEEDLDAIQSNNLGHHARNRGAGYAQLVYNNGRLWISAGGREEVLSGGQSVFSPSFSGTVGLPRKVKLRGAIGYGFRLPTYTDLYYSDPTTVGNPNLKPESAWSYEVGADWIPRPSVQVSVTAFTSPQHDSIDYTRTSPADLWHATNLANFRYTGVESSAEWRPAAGWLSGGRLRGSYTFVSGAQSALGGLQSEYVFNFPVHNAAVEWIAPLHWVGVQTRARLGVTQRFARSAYAVADLSVSRPVGRVQPYLQLTNATNTGYEEIVGVRMQGRTVVGGVSFLLSRPPR